MFSFRCVVCVKHMLLKIKSQSRKFSNGSELADVKVPSKSLRLTLNFLRNNVLVSLYNVELSPNNVIISRSNVIVSRYNVKMIKTITLNFYKIT